MVILKMFAAITKKKKARDGWKHQDVCLVILFFTAFHFERRKMRLKVQVIHISNSHKRFLWLTAASEMTGKKRRKIALSRAHSRHIFSFSFASSAIHQIQSRVVATMSRDERDTKLLFINRTMALRVSLNNEKSTFFSGDGLRVRRWLGFWWQLSWVKKNLKFHKYTGISVTFIIEILC